MAAAALGIGLAGGANLNASVIPFLLRGVNLLSIDSVLQPFENRQQAWQRIASDLPVEKIDAMTELATLSDLSRLGQDILKGRIKGRILVDVHT